ncbi:MAG: type II secretion system F family protein [bacterium]|nr:type II secretion system F family protein [bacterium]
MAIFEYKVRTLDKSIVKGTIEAPDQKTAVIDLHRKRYVVLYIKKKGVKEPFILGKLARKGGARVGLKTLVIFNRQLATLVNAGIPIVQSLSILIEEEKDKRFKPTIINVCSDIEKGSTISEALAKHPKVFSHLYVSMIRSGELGGILDEILLRLAAYYEFIDDLRKKVRSAMVYPTTVLVIAGVIVSFLLGFVVPRFKETFESFGGTLPPLTLMVISMGEFVKDNIIYMIICLIGIIWAIFMLKRTEKGAFVIDGLVLKVPVIGDLIRKIAIAKFSRTLGSLVKSGVSILESLEVAGKTCDNKVIEGAVMESRISIREGERIADPLKKSGAFPPMVVQMIAIGEETGSLDDMLNKISDFYDRESNATIATMSSLIEPVLILFLGIVVGGILIAMFLPIFSLSGLIK